MGTDETAQEVDRLIVDLLITDNSLNCYTIKSSPFLCRQQCMTRPDQLIQSKYVIRIKYCIC